MFIVGEITSTPSTTETVVISLVAVAANGGSLDIDIENDLS